MVGLSGDDVWMSDVDVSGGVGVVPRRRRSAEERRRVVEETFGAGASLARVALKYGVNANEVFAFAVCLSYSTNQHMIPVNAPVGTLYDWGKAPTIGVLDVLDDGFAPIFRQATAWRSARWDSPAIRIPGLRAAFAVLPRGPCAPRFWRKQTGSDSPCQPEPSPCARWPRPNRACCRASHWDGTGRDRQPPSRCVTAWLERSG